MISQMAKKISQRTLESWMIANGKVGKQFYSDKIDRHLTAISVHHKRKISTERIIAVSVGHETKSKYITKVTLL